MIHLDNEALSYSASVNGDYQPRRIMQVNEIPLEVLLNILRSNNFEVSFKKSCKVVDYVKKGWFNEDSRSEHIDLDAHLPSEKTRAYFLNGMHVIKDNRGHYPADGGIGVQIGIKDYQEHIPRSQNVLWALTTGLQGRVADGRKVFEVEKFSFAVNDFRKVIKEFYEDAPRPISEDTAA